MIIINAKKKRKREEENEGSIEKRIMSAKEKF